MSRSDVIHDENRIEVFKSQRGVEPMTFFVLPSSLSSPERMRSARSRSSRAISTAGFSSVRATLTPESSAPSSAETMKKMSTVSRWM